jgi:hypothetical protein
VHWALDFKFSRIAQIYIFLLYSVGFLPDEPIRIILSIQGEIKMITLFRCQYLNVYQI